MSGCPSAVGLWHVWVPTHRVVTVCVGGDVYQDEEYRCLYCGVRSPA